MGGGKTCCFIDNCTDEGMFLQCPIISLDDLLLRFEMKDTVFVITSRSMIGFYNRILNVLFDSPTILFYPQVMLAYPDQFPFQERLDYTVNGVMEVIHYTAEPKNLFKYFNILDCLEDGLSKEILFKIVLFRLTFDVKLNENVKSCYLDYLDEDIITLNNHEIIVDAGGYTGDTLYDFMQYYKEKCMEYQYEYYLFEPSASCVEEAQKITNASNIHFCNYCLGNTNGEVLLNDFSGDSGFSPINTVTNKKDVAGIAVKMVRLDDYLKDTPVTYIKMDIEGTEEEALLGCERIIKKYAPKLAICLYHKPTDIINIFSLIQGMGVQYRYYIRAQKNSVVTEFILYAIPIK